MKRFLFLAAIAFVGCVTSPNESTPAIKVGLYHKVGKYGTFQRLEIKADHSTYAYQVQADSSQIALGYGKVYFAGDTIKISECSACDTASYFSRNDTLLIVKEGNRVPAYSPPIPRYVKE